MTVQAVIHSHCLPLGCVLCGGNLFSFRVGLFHPAHPLSSTMAIYVCSSGLLPCAVSQPSTLFPQITRQEYPDSDSVCVPRKKKHLLIIDLKCTSSLRNTHRLLTDRCPIRHVANGQLDFILHTITGFLWPSLTHYYGFICHLTPTRVLALTLYGCFRHLPGCGARLPQLLHWLPVNNSTLKHSIGLTEYWALRYFARLPT